jgi:hypothetical protein
MLLRHSTPKRNLPGIVRHGLLCGKSQGRLKAVWLHSPARTVWATLHVVKRHGGRVEDVVTLEVEVPRSWLRRNRRGVWYVAQDIPFDRVRRIVTFAEVAGAVACCLGRSRAT